MPKIEQDEDGMLHIWGKRVTEADYPELAGRVGEDEMAVKVPAELIQDYLRTLRQKEKPAS